MNHHHEISERIPYKIKVNKKGSNNNIYKSQNYIVNSYNNNSNSAKIYHMNTYFPSFQPMKSSKNCNKNNSFLIPFSNSYLINTQIKSKTNSNSEEKIRKKNLNINIYDDQRNKDGNILEDLINNKYLKPILECQDIDEKLYNCNLKEPIKNSFNVSLNDFFNRKGNKFESFKTPKIEMSKKLKGLSIKTHYFNNSNNVMNSDIIIPDNRTLENYNNYNNYYNDIKMTNNYYNNNEINLLNVQPYNNNVVQFSSEGRRMKDSSYSENRPLIYYTYETNKNSFQNSSNRYIHNKNKNNIKYVKDDNNYNYYNDYMKLNSPINHVFKSQTYSSKSNKKNIDNYSNKKSNRATFNNKEINIINLGNSMTQKINENIETKNNKYDNIKNIIRENNNKTNKYDYNKKLFDIYRGKLINEFIRHIEKAFNKYLRFFMDSLFNLKSQNKIDEIFIPKINLGKIDKLEENKNIIRSSANIKKKKFSQIFYSEKKFPQKQKYLVNKKNIKSLNLSQINNSNINKSFVINNEKKTNKIFINKSLAKKKGNFQKRKNTNSNISLANRNSLFPNIISKNSNSNNNIQLINNNNSLNQYIYKKKIRLSKNITFVNKTNKLSHHNNKEINKEDILSNSKGKIIDIDINLGKPIKEINDISPLQNLFIKDYNNKKYKSSLSTNKREKRKRKHKSKNKKLSLPKKKYLEEKYDIYPIRNEDDEELEENIYNKNNSFDNNLNNIISLNNSINLKLNNNYFQTYINNNDNNINKNNDLKNKKKNYKNILVKNIKTSDKRLFIHINYLSSLSKNNIKKKNKYDNKTLIIIRNIYFSIILDNANKRQKNISNNTFIGSKNSRNFIRIGEKEKEKMSRTNYIKNYKDKYLLSCVKFIIRNINKVFLNKAYKYFLKNLLEEINKKKIKDNNKYRINTYKKKISKGKIY